MSAGTRLDVTGRHRRTVRSGASSSRRRSCNPPAGAVAWTFVTGSRRAVTLEPMRKWHEFYERMATSRGWLVPLRLVVGFGFASHGYAKLSRGIDGFAAILAALGVAAPGLMAWVTTWLELAGGVFVLVGAFTRLVALPLVLVMLTALVRVHLPYGFSSVRLQGITSAGAHFGPVGYELNLLYIAALLALALAGSTPLSVDRFRAAKRRLGHGAPPESDPAPTPRSGGSS